MKKYLILFLDITGGTETGEHRLSYLPNKTLHSTIGITVDIYFYRKTFYLKKCLINIGIIIIKQSPKPK